MNSKFLVTILVLMCLAVSIQAQNRAQCMAACNFAQAGIANVALQNFCRIIPSPHVKAACWAVQFGSMVACNGFCYAYF
jgi:hypothetical protein